MKLCNFCVLNMNIHVCHLKKMFHLFEYLRYWICTNIIHINHNMKLCYFCINLWKPDFTQNLYKPMRPSKFVMNATIWNINMYFCNYNLWIYYSITCFAWENILIHIIFTFLNNYFSCFNEHATQLLKLKIFFRWVSSIKLT
jgi:hypothetical protein